MIFYQYNQKSENVFSEYIRHRFHVVLAVVGLVSLFSLGMDNLAGWAHADVTQAAILGQQIISENRLMFWNPTAMRHIYQERMDVAAAQLRMFQRMYSTTQGLDIAQQRQYYDLTQAYMDARVQYARATGIPLQVTAQADIASAPYVITSR